MVLLPSVFGSGGLLSNFFLDPSKVLWAIGFLIPLILLYLIRPRPINVAVPSLMFILKDMGKSRVLHFFRTLFRDILLILQLLAILILALALAKPYLNVEREALVQQSIIIVDASASTRAQGDDVFEKIRDAALEKISGDTIIIVNQGSPAILSDNGEPRLSAGDARDLLDDLKPTDTPGNLPTALDIAAQYAGPQSQVTIVSDLILSANEDPELISARMKVLRSKGALVEIVTIENGGDNIGIIDARVNLENASIDVKIQNFNPTPEDFKLEVNDENVQLSQHILAPAGQPGSLLTLTVPVGNGKNEITITPDDELDTDNVYYVSIPEQANVRVLLISGSTTAQQSRVVPALSAAGDQFTHVGIEYAVPPKVPDLEHDLYVLKDLNAQFILPGVISDLRDQAEEGKVVIIFAQPDLGRIDFGDLLPVELKSGQANLVGRLDLDVNDSYPLLRGLTDLGQVDGTQLLRTRAREGAIVYASVGTNDGPEPVIAAKRVGRGAVIYYGIADRPTHDIDPQSYAVLWGRIVDYALTDPMSINVAAGSVLTGSDRIRTPDGTVDAPAVASIAGFYTVGPRTIAANLYPLQRATSITTGATALGGTESALRSPATIDEDTAGNVGGPEGEQEVPYDLSTLMLIAGLAILVIELVYVKLRGDF